MPPWHNFDKTAITVADMKLTAMTTTLQVKFGGKKHVFLQENQRKHHIATSNLIKRLSAVLGKHFFIKEKIAFET